MSMGRGAGAAALPFMIIVMIVLGGIVYYWGTETRTMTIDFSYDERSDSYFAKANLPMGIKGVRLHAEFAITVVPKVTLKITDEKGIPLKLEQGDLKFDANFFADVATWAKGLDGKQVNFSLSFEPSIQTVSYPYLEVAYAALPFAQTGEISG